MTEEISSSPEDAPAIKTEPVVESIDSDEPAGAGFELSSVFSLLGLIVGLLAVGLVSILFIHADDRLENIEKGNAGVVKALGAKVDGLTSQVTKKQNEPAAVKSDPTKNLMIGAEISRTLYLMRYVAGDPSFSEEIRERAAQVHAQADGLLKVLQAEK